MKNINRIVILITLVITFWAGDKLTFQIRTMVIAGHDPFDIINHVLDDFNLPLHLSLHTTDLVAGLALAIIVALTFLYRHTMRKQLRPNEEHGSARWAKPKEISSFANKERHQNILFAKDVALNLDSRATQCNLNSITVGGSGSGKSLRFVGPNLRQANTSFVVTDPKGELHRYHADFLKKQGYQVRQLNLIDFASSHCYNPLNYFNPTQPEVDCMILTDNFIVNTSGRQPAGTDSFWEKAERALLNALISYVYFTSYEEKPATLITVIDLLARMEASEKDENMQSYVDLLFESVSEWIAAYDQDPDKHLWSEETTSAIQGLRFSYSQYRTYIQGAGETQKSVIISLGVRMAPLHMSSLRKVLSTDSIAIDRLGVEKTALFLIIPDTHSTFSFLVSILYEQLFEKNLYIADHLPNGRLPHQLHCIMDEFANIGKMPSFERKIAVMRSRAINVSIIVQNLAQGKALYKDHWETIIGNCDSLLFLGGNEKSTTEYISKMLGKQTIHSIDHSQTRGRNGSWSESDKTLGRELLTPDEIATLPTGKCLYFLRGMHPYMTDKLDITK
ncbi:VirD4-like conjugal transfer protein, CD1115 family [Arcanobacterium bovis]|uniref:Type IV secretory system conjugative DNA transfer family protein n=1 Tax=Arcanobacterium bovis TaxID=2529275 RepID=A0A4Q9V099_9ACTO|nr:type IV secretory system conjugative DNA transfer family protein [Arcanobacterium bovis]TBW20716.1 type IV secretory system conjugative DNA transfer family protein [Arcanobacterium bovis]